MLPAPSDLQRIQSEKLCTIIQQKISSAPNHIISLAEYMQMSLYTPELGYYMADHPIFGSNGDFVTAPEISTLFSQCIARPVSEILEKTGGNILEIGAGNGKLASGLLSALPTWPDYYYIYEISPVLRARQQQWLSQTLPQAMARVVWLEQLPERFSGVMLANEVIDALPAHSFALTAEGIQSHGVTFADEQFQWALSPASAELATQVQNILSQLPEPLSAPYVSELHLHLSAWMKEYAQRLQEGVWLIWDYGFPRREYYHPQRHMGTLMCHYKQYAHGDLFWYPGIQDLTVHVDFTAVAESALANGLDVLGYTAQAPFLIECGLIDMLREMPMENFSAKQAVNWLTSPAEMGELFKVMALGKNVEFPLTGFQEYPREYM